MQRSWDQFSASDPVFAPAQPKFTPDEVNSFLEEVAQARDRESFNRLIARFDAQFLSKFKARFPSTPGRFPFGSAGKPYTFGITQGFPQPYDRPMSAATSQVQTERYRPDGYQMYQPPQYRAQTPMMPGFQMRTEQPYSAPMYERPAEYRPASSYPNRGFPGHNEPPLSADPSSYSYPPQAAPPLSGKSGLNSLSDYAELRKSKEDTLTRFQAGAQRAPKA